MESSHDVNAMCVPVCRCSSRQSEAGDEGEKRHSSTTTTKTTTAAAAASVTDGGRGGDVSGVPVRALFDYRAQEPDELSFTAGQRLDRLIQQHLSRFNKFVCKIAWLHDALLTVCRLQRYNKCLIS